MTHVVAAEDCVEFRMLQIACGVRTADEWFERFLAPERIAVADYVRPLTAAGRPWRVTLAPTREQLLQAVSDADALIVERQRVDAELIAAAPRLRRVVVYGSDPQFVDGEACARRGISVTCVRRRTTANVADHVLLLTLALSRRLLDGALVTEGTSAAAPASTEHGGHPPTLFNWVGAGDIDALEGRRFGVLGAGETGSEVLRRAHAFGMEVAYAGRRRVPRLEEQLGARHLSLEDLPLWADVVSLHLPYAPELRHVVDSPFLAALGPRGILINTSRGLLVDTAALVQALHAGTIRAAGLDVFDREPLPEGHPLLDAPNVILTPHVGAGTRWHLVTDVVNTIQAVAEGLEGA